MTNKEAIRILDEQRNKFMDEWVDFGGVNEAYNMAIQVLKEQEEVEPFHRCIGKDFSLIEDSHFDYCPYCGKPITWAKQEGR